MEREKDAKELAKKILTICTVYDMEISCRLAIDLMRRYPTESLLDAAEEIKGHLAKIRPELDETWRRMNDVREVEAAGLTKEQAEAAMRRGSRIWDAHSAAVVYLEMEAAARENDEKGGAA